MQTADVISGETYNFPVMVSDGELTAPVDVSVSVRPQAASLTRAGIQLNWIDGIDLVGGNNNDNFDAYEQLTVEIVTGPQHGVLFETQNGEFRWIPLGTFRGTDTFSYRLSRNGLQSEIAVVTIDLTAELLPFGGYREGDSFPYVPPSRAETEPGAIGDLDLVEIPAAGFDSDPGIILQDPLQDLYPALNVFIADYLDGGFADAPNTDGWTDWARNGWELVVDEFLGEYSFSNTSAVEKSFLLHFLGKTGYGKELNVVQMIRDVPIVQADYEAKMSAAMALVADLEFIGTVYLTEEIAKLEQSGGNFSLGVGQYTTWGGY